MAVFFSMNGTECILCYECTKVYFVFGLADNQTKLNLQENKVGVLSLYQYNPKAEDKMERNVGARIKFEVVEDEDIINKLSEENEIREGSIICHAVEVLPLG